MMFLNRIRYYQIALIMSAILLAVWQYTIVSGDQSSDITAGQLSFTMNSGAIVSLPVEGSNKYSIVIFWKSESDRSLQLMNEALTLYKEPEFDTLATLYLVNLFDSLAVIRSAIDFDNPDIPFARDPKGIFLNQNPIRSLPVIAVFGADGRPVNVTEGYQEGGFRSVLSHLEQLIIMTGGQRSGFNFKFGGGSVK
jgi:hypothetical protein